MATISDVAKRAQVSVSTVSYALSGTRPITRETKDRIQKAIDESNPKVAFLHKVGPEGTAGDGALCLKFILTAKDGKPLYFDNHKISSSKPDAFLLDDFKNIAK